MENTKLVVVGAGAMGSLFGGLLAEKGMDVTLLDPWQQHIDAIKANNGLQMVGHGGDRTIPLQATTNAQEIKEADLVFFQCKAVYNDAAATSVKHLFTSESNTIAISFQNGLGSEEKIAEYLGKENVLGGLTAQGANMEAPGKVRNHTELPSYIGEMGGGVSDRVSNVANILTAHGLPTKASENIRKSIWAKLFANVGVSPISGILNITLGEIYDNAYANGISFKAIDEAVLVAEAEGLSFTQEEASKVFKSIINPQTGTPGNKSSLCVDLLNERPSEIDYINGAIARLGKKHNIPTAINDTLTSLVKAIESKFTNE